MNKKKITPAEESEPLSLEEISLLRSEQERSGEDRSQLPPHDTSERAHVLRFARKNKLFTLSAVFVAAALLAGALLGGILLWRHLTSPTDTQLQKNDPIQIIYGDEKPVEIKYGELVRDGIFYVDLLDIAEHMDLTVSGNTKRLRFSTSAGSYILLQDGDEYAIINGTRVLLTAEPVLGGEEQTAPAVVSSEQCLVPFSFLESAVADGFSMKLNSHTNTLRIRRILNMVDGDKENAVPALILFTADPFEEVIFPMDKEDVTYEYHYPIDITPYLDSILSEQLVLANKSHALGADYAPSDLTKLTCETASGRDYYLRVDAANALYAMMAAMAADGVSDVYVTSAYRSYDYQVSLYEGYVKKHMVNEGLSREEAEAKASTYSSRPGESEHQTGLCLDFTAKEVGGALNESFEGTEAYAWLAENAWQYGFILRYPKSDAQIAITGYDYEPWHYRFVGRYAATEIYHGNLTLEEYLVES